MAHSPKPTIKLPSDNPTVLLVLTLNLLNPRKKNYRDRVAYTTAR